MDHDKYIITHEFDKLTAEIVFASKNDISDFVKKEYID